MSHHSVIPASSPGALRAAAPAAFRSSYTSPVPVPPAETSAPEPTVQAAPTPRRRVITALITPAIVLVATLGGHAVWTWQAERRFDRYVEGLRRTGEPVSLSEVLGPPVADADNGALDLRAAAEAINTETWGEFYGLPALGMPLTEREVE